MSLFEWLPAFIGLTFFAGAALLARHAESKYKAADERLIEALKQEHRNAITEVMKEANNG